MATRGKKFFFALILILLTWGILELLALAAYPIAFNAPFSKAAVKDELRALARDPDPASPPGPSAVDRGEWTAMPEILHPYVGFMPSPEHYPYPFDLGFPLGRSTNPIRKRSPGTLTIAVFGGSFAEGIYASAGALADNLKPLDRQVVVLNFAYGGYKQPQALATLAYLLAMGAEFDVVVNVDGFNEVAIPPVENTPHGVAHFYPRQWHRRLDGTPDPVRLRRIGRIEFLKQARRDWAGWFLEHTLYRSPLAALAWQARDRSLRRSLQESREALEAPTDGRLSFEASGPVDPRSSGRALYRDLARIWMRSSLQMHALCQGNGIAYFHFLQPNQYLEGSKPMSDEERRLAVTPGHPYQEGVVNGYPLLRRAGEDLLKAGVAFTDLTQVFQDRPEPLYADACCHPSREGYDLVAARMALAMRPLLPDRLLPETAGPAGLGH